MFLKHQGFFIAACPEKWSFHLVAGRGVWGPAFWIFWIRPCLPLRKHFFDSKVNKKPCMWVEQSSDNLLIANAKLCIKLLSVSDQISKYSNTLGRFQIIIIFWKFITLEFLTTRYIHKSSFYSMPNRIEFVFLNKYWVLPEGFNCKFGRYSWVDSRKLGSWRAYQLWDSNVRNASFIHF